MNNSRPITEELIRKIVREEIADWFDSESEARAAARDREQEYREREERSAQARIFDIERRIRDLE